jgi:hypothetical protein
VVITERQWTYIKSKQSHVDSQGNHYVIEGQPAVPFTSTAQKAQATVFEFLSGPENNRDSPFGRLVGVAREGATVDAIRPSETIAQDANLSGQWTAVQTFMNHDNTEG